MVGNDLSAVNAIGIAVHNVVKGLHHMRSVYSDIGLINSLSPESAATQCLRAPASVYRQSTEKGAVLGATFAKHSLFVLRIGAASQDRGGRSLVFMEDSWSKCPASRWVPALFEGVWLRALKDVTDDHLHNIVENIQVRQLTSLPWAAENGDKHYADAR